ncbi:MAG: hypothetical protein H7144_17925 [Burkholderiales bacterium]|nr:hypothetical protein [Phycisphaerae bacterium]
MSDFTKPNLAPPSTPPARLPDQSPERSRVIALIKFTLLILVFIYVGRALWTQWQKIDFNTVHIRPLPLVMSFLVLISVSTVQMISYRTLLGAYAHAPTWRQMLAVAWLPPIGKYIPGKVAALLAAMSMLRRYGIPIAVAVSVVLALDGLAVLAGLIVGAPLLFWRPIREVAPWGPAVGIPVMVAGVICLWPSIFGRIVNFVLQKLKKQPLSKMPPVGQYLIPVCCAFGQWLLTGIALLLMVGSVTGDWSIRHLPLMIGFAALSQTIGYLALFAPGSLGVREAILLIGLTPLVGPQAAIIVVIRAVAQIVLDVLLALLGFLILKSENKRDSAPTA